MHQWLDFINFFFWFTIFGFLINYNNFLFIFLYSELTWLLIYSLSVSLGLYFEDLNAFSNTFFALGFAGIEFSIGFLLIILFKNFNMSFNLIENSNILNYSKLF